MGLIIAKFCKKFIRGYTIKKTISNEKFRAVPRCCLMKMRFLRVPNMISRNTLEKKAQAKFPATGAAYEGMEIEL